LNEEARKQLAEDDASLTLVVGDVTSKLDELSKVDVRDVEVLDLGVELDGVSKISRSELFGKLTL
jgi:hypothetical protein